MKAIQYVNYGSPEVLNMQETSIPVPKTGEVLIRIHATTVTAADIMMRTGKPYLGRLYTGLKGPKRTTPGFEFAGEVVEVGKDVKLFKAGDRIFGGTTKLGCYAEYVCVSETEVITTIPDNISYNEAAPVNGSAITVMNFLKRLGNIQKGHKVLINGASGGLGTYAVQIAKHFGANVTGVCSTDNMPLVKSLGADRVIDYTMEDFTKDEVKYDIIFDTVNKKTFSECKKSLSENGIYLSTVFGIPLFTQIILTAIVGGKKAKTSATGLMPVPLRLKYFEEIKEMFNSGKLKTVIDQSYPLSQVVDAHKYVEKGHKRGNVIITV